VYEMSVKMNPNNNSDPDVGVMLSRIIKILVFT